MTEFLNKSGMEFTDISSEAWREYDFGAKGSVRIESPTHLSVSDSGGHRVFDAGCVSHYIPAGWLQLHWQAKAGAPQVVK